MILLMLYQALKVFTFICFNLLNMLLGGNLPPFVCICAIVEKEQRFLVIEQRSGKTVFPAGFVRWKEYPEQAVIHEGEEETGLELRPICVFGYYPQSSNCIAYQAQVTGGKLRESIEGHPYWINEEDLLDKLTPYYQVIFQDYLQYREQLSETNIHRA